MAFSITTSYAGIDSQEIIGKALLGADTFNNQCLTILPGVKHKTTLHKLSTTDLVQADGCNFAASGDVVLADKTIFPQAQKVNLELCKTDLEQHWISAQMQAGALNSDIPASFGDFILDYVAARVAQKIDNQIWMADSSGADAFDGLIREGFLDGDVVDVTFVAITPANVIAQMQAMYDAIPDEVINEPDFKFIVAMNVAKAYKQAVATASAEKYFVGDVPLDFLGIPMIPVRGLAASHMMGAQVSNLFMGTDLMSDFNEARVIDMTPTDGSQNVRVIMRFKLDVCFAWGAQVVLYQNTFV